MENRKKQLKISRRNMSRRIGHNHGRYHRVPPDARIIPNCLASKKEHFNRGLIKSPPSSSTSMRAFNFSVDSRSSKQNFVSLPKESADRRIVPYQSLPMAPLYKNPASLALNGPLRLYLLGGVNLKLNFDDMHWQVPGKQTSDYLGIFKKISSNTTPTDRDIIFGSAKTFLEKTRGWENSRIQWLLDLERLQEMRRARANLPEDDFVDICCFPFSANLLMLNIE